MERGRDAVLREDIQRIFEENFKFYEARKVWRQMKLEGIDVAQVNG